MIETKVKPVISGKVLRWVVCLELHDAKRALTIAEIVARVEERYTIHGRAGKTVSDALRWEVGRGRVRQQGRGSYEPGRMQRSTEWSMRRRVEAWRLSLVAHTAASSSATVRAPVMSAAEARRIIDSPPAEELAESFAPFDADAADAAD